MVIDPLDRYWLLVEAAKALDVNPDTLRKLAIRDRIPGARRWGKRWVFDREKLLAFKRTYRSNPGRPPGPARRVL
jgi:excisionase family DNA binding protein